MSSIRELLSAHRDFRRLFLASVISMAGDWFAFVALADLVTQLTGRQGAPAFVFAATVLPMFFASPFAGAAADRFDRRRLLIGADVIRVPLALALCVAAWIGSASLAIGAVVALGVAASFHDPITSAVVPNLVPAHQLSRAQALLGAVWGSMLFIGAGLGGIVAELLGMQAAFLINAASFAVSAWLLAGIRTPMQEASAEERRARSSKGQFREVLRYVQKDRIAKRFVLAKVGVSCANGTVGLLPAFAAERFAGTNIATGLLFAARGLGALLGPLLARWIAGAAPRARVIVVVCGVSTLLYVAIYALIPFVYWFPLALGAVIVAHVGGGAQWSLSTYGLQVMTPDALRGRIMSLDYGIATLAIGASALVAGVLADITGVANAMWWLVAAGAVYGVLWMIWGIMGTRESSP
ncbi:MAG: MFS transporter [Kofleriaceae bacterium]